MYLQCGKIDEDKFILDVAFPFNLVQAFGICMSAFEFRDRS